MKLTLEIKQKCSWFWLRAIHSVRIDRCCTGCFNAAKDNRIYNATRFKDYALISIEIEEDPRAIAYYLCGISAGMKWEDNTHVAFVPKPGERIRKNNKRIGLIITGAREIHFQDYKPNPPGVYTKEQRTCRNWIFANYVRDGMLRRDLE